MDSIDEDDTIEILTSVINEINQFLGRIDGVDIYTRSESNPTESNPQIDKGIKSLIKIDFANPQEIIRLIEPIEDDEVGDSNRFYLWFDLNPYLINYCIPQTTKLSLLKAIVSEISKWILTQTEDRSAKADCLAYHFLWRCSELMTYKDFYESWHSQPTSTHPEIADTTPSNNTNKIQTLESQLIDCDAIQKELDRNTDHPEIRCLVIDIRHLEQESDPNVIAKKLTNKIFSSIGRRIPVVQDVSCLERELLNLKFELGFEKFAIALYGKNANEAINQLCQNLSPIHTRLFTGGQTSEQLTNEVKAWLRRINLEYN